MMGKKQIKKRKIEVVSANLLESFLNSSEFIKGIDYCVHDTITRGTEARFNTFKRFGSDEIRYNSIERGNEHQVGGSTGIDYSEKLFRKLYNIPDNVDIFEDDDYLNQFVLFTHNLDDNTEVEGNFLIDYPGITDSQDLSKVTEYSEYYPFVLLHTHPVNSSLHPSYAKKKGGNGDINNLNCYKHIFNPKPNLLIRPIAVNVLPNPESGLHQILFYQENFDQVLDKELAYKAYKELSRYCAGSDMNQAARALELLTAIFGESNSDNIKNYPTSDILYKTGTGIYNSNEKTVSYDFKPKYFSFIVRN